MLTSKRFGMRDSVFAMKISTASIFASLSLALILPLSAQVAATAEAVKEAAPVVPDGIVFYNGLPYLLRNGRAFLIDATLVPPGQILTYDGKYAPLPAGYAAFPAVAVKKGTDQQTVQGSVPIVAPEVPPTVPKGTDQQTLINPPRPATGGKVTGSGGLIRK